MTRRMPAIAPGRNLSICKARCACTQSIEVEALHKESDWIGIKKILEPVAG